MTDDPQDPQDDDLELESPDLKKAMPEGIRVVRKQGKRRAGRQGSRETVFLKKREILREMQDTGSSGVNVRQQVQALKEAPSVEVPLEDKWGSRQQGRRGLRWILSLVFLLVIPLVGVIVVVSLLREPGGNRVAKFSETGLNLDESGADDAGYDSTSPESWFQENLSDAYSSAVQILGAIGDADSVPAEFLRDGERTTKLIAESGVGWGSPFAVENERTLELGLGAAGETGLMTISGRRKNFEPFRACFVKTEDGVRLDWEATTARSEVPLEDLATNPPEGPTVMRIWISKQPHFDSDVGRNNLFSWYQLLNPAKDEFVWAHVPVNGELDTKLKSMLNYGRWVLELKREVRAIVRIAKPQVGFRENEFELLEVITDEWVMP